MMMIACNRDTGRLFLREELAAEQEETFTEHLETCDGCRRWLEEDSGDETTWHLARQLIDDSPARPAEDDDALDSPTRLTLSQVAEQIKPHLAPSDDPSMMGRIGSYEIIGVIGRGGMGIVLKAYEKSLDRNVALKVLDPMLSGTATARKRFAREANAMASISHPNVVPIYAVDAHRHLPYFAMEYVVGETLASRIQDSGPIGIESTIRVSLQVAEALAAAHAHGLVHRDIKPANILMDRGTDRIRVADFGLARVASDASYTRTGIVAGTPQYMSPEQVRGEACDGRADLFSLGSVIYAMLTGHAPFRAESVFGVMQRIVNDDARNLQEHNADVPTWLEQLTRQLMAKEAEQRFDGSNEVADMLREELAYIQDPTHARQPSRTWMPTKSKRSIPRGQLTAIVVTFLTLAALLRAWFPVGFSQVTAVNDDGASAVAAGGQKLPDVQTILNNYEKALAPYDCFHGKWMVKQSWGYAGEVKPQRSETHSFWQDGDRFRSIKMRVGNHDDSDVSPIGSYYEFIHDRPDRYLTIEPSGKVYCNDPSAFDFKSVLAGSLHHAPTPATFGVDGDITPLVQLLRNANPKVTLANLDGHEVYEVRGATAQADITIWIDLSLNHAARRIRCMMLKPPIRGGNPIPGYQLRTSEFQCKEFQKVGELYVPSVARYTSVSRNQESKVESHHIREITLVDIDFRKKMTPHDFGPMKPIKNGAPVTFNDRIFPPTHHYWQNGEAVVDESKVVKRQPRKSEPIACLVEGNLAHGKLTKASSEQEGNVSRLAVDGDLSTRWCAAGGGVGQWWEVDLGKSLQIKSVRLHWEKIGTTYFYKILTSSDREKWNTVVDRFDARQGGSRWRCLRAQSVRKRQSRREREILADSIRWLQSARLGKYP